MVIAGHSSGGVKYAIPVHQRLDLRHDRGQALFVEAAVEQVVESFSGDEFALMAEPPSRSGTSRQDQGWSQSASAPDRAGSQSCEHAPKQRARRRRDRRTRGRTR